MCAGSVPDLVQGLSSFEKKFGLLDLPFLFYFFFFFSKIGNQVWYGFMMRGRCEFYEHPSFRCGRVDRASSFRHGRVSGVKEVGTLAVTEAPIVTGRAPG